MAGLVTSLIIVFSLLLLGAEYRDLNYSFRKVTDCHKIIYPNINIETQAGILMHSAK